MSWTYRVSKQTLDNGDVIFAIREFYPSEITGKLNSWTADEMVPIGDSLDGLKWTLQQMFEACDKEIIDIGNERSGLGDPSEWETLINESIRVLEFLRVDTKFQNLTDAQKVMIVKGFLNNLSESDK